MNQFVRALNCHASGAERLYAPTFLSTKDVARLQCDLGMVTCTCGRPVAHLGEAYVVLVVGAYMHLNGNPVAGPYTIDPLTAKALNLSDAKLRSVLEYIDTYVRWLALPTDDEKPKRRVALHNVVARALLATKPLRPEALSTPHRLPFECVQREEDGQMSVHGVAYCCLRMFMASLQLNIKITAACEELGLTHEK